MIRAFFAKIIEYANRLAKWNPYVTLVLGVALIGLFQMLIAWALISNEANQKVDIFYINDGQVEKV